jgi:Lateral organ boundaries (LOB) domain
MSSSNLVEGNYSERCACKHLRRRCAEDCILAPYFPATHPERFECVHEIFIYGFLSLWHAYMFGEHADLRKWYCNQNNRSMGIG